MELPLSKISQYWVSILVGTPFPGTFGSALWALWLLMEVTSRPVPGKMTLSYKSYIP